MTRTEADWEQCREIINQLVVRRKLLGITQTEIAKRMNVAQSWVSSFEKAGHDPQISTLQRYARAIGVAISIEVVDVEM